MSDPAPSLNGVIESLNASRLAAYDQCRHDLAEHHGIEQTILAGGYGYRQILELVQNGADAILDADTKEDANSRIAVVLKDHALYVANTGSPLSEKGLIALLSSHSSPKRGNEIGRFGLGFKSLLRLGGKIDIASKATGGVRFDPERCREELQHRFSAEQAPALRLAWPLGEEQNASLLSEFSWAETVVRAEIKADSFESHLAEEIRAFPEEFLLFLDAPIEIHLNDGAGWSANVVVRHEGPERVLCVGEDTTRWAVFQREVKVSEEAPRNDATHIHARESVPICWALPIDVRREESGRFWFFFPTQTPTFLPGILNAPWKLNSDRNALIRGEWNAFLMREAAALIVESIPTLHHPDDPGRLLDFFPRQLTSSDEVAATLAGAIWEGLEKSASIPDGNGMLAFPTALHRHPLDRQEIVAEWERLAFPDQRKEFIHSTCLLKQRPSRSEALAERLQKSIGDESSCPALTRPGAGAWFNAIAAAEQERASNVLRLAEAFLDTMDRPARVRCRNLRIVPLANGELATPDEAVFADPDFEDHGRKAVAAWAVSDPETQRILRDVLGVQSLGDDFWKRILGEHFPPGNLEPADDAKWRTRWKVLRSAPQSVLADWLTSNLKRLRVLRRDGKWVSTEDALLPGGLVSPENVSKNAMVLVDTEFHQPDASLLARIGVQDSPTGTTHGSDHAFPAWLSACRDRYITHCRSAGQNWGNRNYIEARRAIPLPKGWALLPMLEGLPNTKFTQHILRMLAGGEFGPITDFGNHANAAYPKIRVSHPLPWHLMEHGQILVGGKTVRISAFWARQAYPFVGERVAALGLDRLFGANDPVPVPPKCDARDFEVLWEGVIAEAVNATSTQDDSLSQLWTSAAGDGVIPQVLPSPSGPVPLSEVFVTTAPELARRIRRDDRLVVTLDEKTLELWVERGARQLNIQPEWEDPQGPATLLVTVFPEFCDILTTQSQEAARCRFVSSLAFRVEGIAEPVPSLLWGDELLLDTQQLGGLSRGDRFNALLHSIAGSGWLDRPVEKALAHLVDSGLEERRSAVANAGDLPERLLCAVGGRKEALLAGLGEIGTQDWIANREPVEIARLALASFGPATLMTYQNALEQEGLLPPSRWGTIEARDFVAAIGFPVEFASSPAARREPEEIITGPIDLPPLHDFQDQVFAGIEQLLANGAPRRRAVISLPTGGGKTRVTVEAAVCLVLNQASDRRSVLWIAQTDELCEQAVQAFRQVWINKGTKRTDLRIVRFWGSNPNPSPPADGRPVAVVASIQTLNSRMGIADLAWLEFPGLVVIDECHHAIAPSYTGLLGWLNAAYRPPGAAAVNEPPILGLSATPFRMDDEESARLAKRFDQRWFPDNQAELHARLLAQGVLARVESEELASGAMLSPQELDALSQFDSMEGIEIDRLLEAINQRLAGDAKRNERIIERLMKASERSILLFANSVDHATELSARLNLCGISAAAISGGTARSARRWFLDRFQRGEIRVLCNHSVLTTGFDAPKTDLILISRQVFSPVRYMQMVGRGLRGPRNGGTPTCRIVSVLDNLGRFQNRHPYHYCRQYFETLAEQPAELQTV